jgi:hypothetical protein
MKKLKEIIKFRKISFDSKRLKHYGARKYKEYEVCQLEGCEKPVKRFGKNRRNKYCSPRHARQAKNVYKRLWELKNSDKVKEYKKKYNYRKLHTPEDVYPRKKKRKERKKETRPRKITKPKKIKPKKIKIPKIPYKKPINKSSKYYIQLIKKRDENRKTFAL